MRSLWDPFVKIYNLCVRALIFGAYCIFHPRKGANKLWYKWRMWSYIPSPKLPGVCRYFEAELTRMIADFGVYLGVKLIYKDPYNLVFTAVNRETLRELPEPLINNILVNCWGLTPNDYIVATSDKSEEGYVYSYIFNNKVFLKKAGEVYNKREVSLTSRLNDGGECLAYAIYNAFAISVFVFLAFICLNLLELGLISILFSK